MYTTAATGDGEGVLRGRSLSEARSAREHAVAADDNGGELRGRSPAGARVRAAGHTSCRTIDGAVDGPRARN
eukprot:8279136-Alexandrium_andersonii.AAC.1